MATNTYDRPSSARRRSSRLMTPAWIGTSSAATELVEHDQLRLQSERPDADALALAAREVLRETVGVRRLEADQAQQLVDPLVDLGLLDAVRLERLGEHVVDEQTRIERRHRILEHHLQVASYRLALRLRQPGEVLAEHRDTALLRRQQIEDLQQRRGLAASRLADQAERLALAHVDREVVDGVHGADLALEDRSLEHRERLGEPSTSRTTVRSEAPASSGFTGTSATG